MLSIAVACDRDPSRPTEVFALTQCPASPVNVNEAITLTFTQPVAGSTVVPGNVVVTDAATGAEIPGTVSRSATNQSAVVFTASAPLPFDTALRVRVHNLVSDATSTPIGVTVCEFRTQLPPIRELFWRELPRAGGNDLLGASLIEPDFGYVMARTLPLFRWTGGPDFVSVQQPPYFSAGYDVSFVSRDRGFATFEEFRQRRSVITETTDGGATIDTIGFASQQSLNRAYFLPIPSVANPFGIVAGGRSFGPALFMKFRPATRSFTSTSISGTGGVSDVDVAPGDTTRAAGVTLGIQLGTNTILGTLFTSSDGGVTWTEVPGARATPDVLTYLGVAVRRNGEIFVAGGNGFLMRFRPTAAGYDTTRMLVGAVTSPDSTNPQALIYTDVQFAPDNDQIGWVIGAQLVGFTGGVPRYQGLIFVTRNGGATWTRQGVRGAEAFGAEFPRLNRLSVLSSTAVWAAGEGGTVLDYRPTGSQ